MQLYWCCAGFRICLSRILGVVWYDTEQQLLQWGGQPNVFTDGSYLSDHHPVFDTMIFGTFMRLGAFFGSADRGLYLGCVVIELVTVAALASMILYCRHIGAGWRFCFAEMIFFALFPCTALFSMTMVKDSVFVPFFIWFAIVFIEAVRTRGSLLKRPQYFAAFLLTALLMGLTKKLASISYLYAVSFYFLQYRRLLVNVWLLFLLSLYRYLWC